MATLITSILDDPSFTTHDLLCLLWHFGEQTPLVFVMPAPVLWQGFPTAFSGLGRKFGQFS